MEENSRDPTKRRRCREDASLVRCNLKNPKPRCEELDFYMRKSNLSWDSYALALAKHGRRRRREDSVKNGIHFEKQDWEIELSSLEPTSSTSKECDSSANDSEYPESDEASQTSGVVDGNKLNLRTGSFNTFEKTKILSENGIYDMNNEEYLNAFGEDFNTSTELFNSDYIAEHDEDEIGLIDVHLTVNASCRAENVPFVCLTSKLDGKAVLGHPVEIEEVTDFSKTLIPKLSDEEGTRFDRLVWRTSRRTPVCYVRNSVSSVSGNFKTGQASKNGLVAKDGSHQAIMKNQGRLKKGRAESSASCVPVERIFSKILAAVGGWE